MFGGVSIDGQSVMKMVIFIFGGLLLVAILIRMLFWGKIKDRLFPPKTIYAPALRFCEDQAIRPFKLKINLLCAQHEKESKAWHNIRQLYIKWTDGKMYLPVSDRDCIPMDFFGVLSKEDRESLNDLSYVAVSAADNVSVETAKQNAQMTIAYGMVIVIGLAALALAVMGIVTIFKGGV